MNIFLRKFSTLNLDVGFVRKTLLRLAGTIALMLIAGLLGGYIASILIRPIHGDLNKFAIGIFIGCLVGMCVGTFVNRMWNRFEQTLKNKLNK